MARSITAWWALAVVWALAGLLPACDCGDDDDTSPGGEVEGEGEGEGQVVHPGAAEVCNGRYEDCDFVADDGVALTDYWGDADGDGYVGGWAGRLCNDPGAEYVTRGGDCHDGLTAYNPAAAEVCDGGDNVCDGLIDDGLVFTDYWGDADGDTHGEGWAGRLCSDPGVPEVCDAIDNGCDGRIDRSGRTVRVKA
jgi:hypothetical protein